jgi:hypothetical protein
MPTTTIPITIPLASIKKGQGKKQQQQLGKTAKNDKGDAAVAGTTKKGRSRSFRNSSSVLSSASSTNTTTTNTKAKTRTTPKTQHQHSSTTTTISTKANLEQIPKNKTKSNNTKHIHHDKDRVNSTRPGRVVLMTTSVRRG